jgi:hypothetical protein
MRYHFAGVLAAVVLVVGLVGAFGGTAAAMDFDRTEADTNETAFDSENRSSAATNDSLAEVGVDVGLEDVGGDLRIDCTGELLAGHDCEKGGVLDLGIVAIDYDGAMGGPIAELGYWFDDHIVVYLAGVEAQVEFSCDMSVENVTCPVKPSLSLPDPGGLDPGNVTVVDEEDVTVLEPENGTDLETGDVGDGDDSGSLGDRFEDGAADDEA